MGRKKEYLEEEVIEKAMNLFWRNGYETTSMQMLEKEMGINKFSIYASFGNKNGVFIKSLACYQQKLKVLLETLNASNNGIAGIKQYFYDFVAFTKEIEFGKGCLVTNTANELGAGAEPAILTILSDVTEEVKQAFTKNLQQDTTKDPAIIVVEADYLLIAMFGLSSATKMFTPLQLNHYIEQVFEGR